MPSIGLYHIISSLALELWALTKGRREGGDDFVKSRLIAGIFRGDSRITVSYLLSTQYDGLRYNNSADPRMARRRGRGVILKKKPTSSDIFQLLDMVSALASIVFNGRPATLQRPRPTPPNHKPSQKDITLLYSQRPPSKTADSPLVTTQGIYTEKTKLPGFPFVLAFFFLFFSFFLLLYAYNRGS